MFMPSPTSSAPRRISPAESQKGSATGMPVACRVVGQREAEVETKKTKWQETGWVGVLDCVWCFFVFGLQSKSGFVSIRSGFLFVLFESCSVLLCKILLVRQNWQKFLGRFQTLRGCKYLDGFLIWPGFWGLLKFLLSFCCVCQEYSRIVFLCTSCFLWPCLRWRWLDHQWPTLKTWNLHVQLFSEASCWHSLIRDYRFYFAYSFALKPLAFLV